MAQIYQIQYGDLFCTKHVLDNLKKNMHRFYILTTLIINNNKMAVIIQ